VLYENQTLGRRVGATKGHLIFTQIDKILKNLLLYNYWTAKVYTNMDAL
jgi:hypothetical protein